MQTRFAFLCAIPVLGLIACSCTTGPRAPQPGTPAFYWAAAKETYRTGDYLKTSNNLEQLTRTENEFTARARLWAVAVSSGLAQAYNDMADTYEAGARANRANPTPFRRQVSQYRAAASSAALQFVEAFHNFQTTSKDPNVTLEFEFPAGNALQPPELKRVSSGILVQDSERDLLLRNMIQRGVLLSVCRAVGAPEDAARARELFQKGNGEVAADTFKMAMADLLHEQAQLFGPAKLDQPNRVKLLCGEAMETLSSLPPNPKTKALSTKIQKTLKKSRIS
ncbi:MAG: hypothetical protein M1436_10680 [Acidobacteria bacterium]|nr:hypothetical protein [Acidobacteriota bacterium]